MRILLFSMPDVTPASADSMCLPSLGIASLAGNVNRVLHTVKIADLVLHREGYAAYVEQLIVREQPDLVGLSGLTCSIQTALELAQVIKHRFPQIHIVFGGYMVLCHLEELMQPNKAKWIDFLIRGEGEFTFQELLNAIETNQNYRDISGLSYKIAGKFVHNPPRALADLTHIALPNRRARLLQKGLHFWGQPADVVETSRGCTFDCAFCCVSQQYQRIYREYSVDRVMADLEQVYTGGTRFIVFADDNLTLSLERLEILCDAIIKARFKQLRFFAQAAVKAIAQHPEIVRKMRHAGFEVIFLGLENLIDRNLKFLNKKTSNYEFARQAIENLRRHDIISTAGIIMGNPDDRTEDLWLNYQRIKALKVDLPNFMTLTPFPKTKIRTKLEAENLITNPYNYAKYDLIQANVRTHHLSDKELYQLVKLFFRRYYFSFNFVCYNRMIRKYWRYTMKYARKELFHWFRSCFKKRKNRPGL